MDGPNQIDLAAIVTLTNREKECLRGVLELLSTKEIALKLGISPETVKTRLASARAKLGTQTSTAAAKMLALYEGGEPPARGSPSEGLDAPADPGLLEPFPVAEPVAPTAVHEERQPFVFNDESSVRLARNPSGALGSLAGWQKVALWALGVLFLTFAIIAAPPLAQSVHDITNQIVPPGR